MSGANASPGHEPPGWTGVGPGDRPADPAAAPEPRFLLDSALLRSPRILLRLLDRPLWLGILFCIAYLVLEFGTAFFAADVTKSTPWNPQAALALALIATAGLRFFPAVVVAVLLAEILVRNTPAGFGSLVSAVATAIAYSAAGYAVRHFTRWTRAEVSLRDLSVLMVIALATSFAVAILLGVTHGLAGTVPLQRLPVVSLQVVIGEALGMIVAAPAMLLFVSGAWRAEAANTVGRGHLGRDLLLFSMALALLLLLIFRVQPFDQFRMSYLLFLPMIVIAARHGLFGTAVALPLVQIGLMAAVSMMATRVATAFEFQMLTLALAVTAMYLGLLSSERERAAQRLAARERELREQRSALSEAQRTAATAELSASLAHDLNQPLSAIGTYARAARLLAERDDGERKRLLDALEKISAESARAGQYVKRMRDFFRTGAMHSEEVRVEELLDRARAHLRDRLERRSIAVDTEIRPALPVLRTDAVQVGAILDNLLGNACDALTDAPPPRRIRVVVGPAPVPLMLRITVQDNGPGVPAELRSQLFRPLATNKPHGMGLGLALSRSIAERLGGALSFDAANRLTTFHLDLPSHE